MQSERYPLPFGWIKESDQVSGRPFYVDTKANPPRRIWTHPYEDTEYLRAHPDVREKLNTNGFGGSDTNLLSPSSEESQRRHSFAALSSRSRLHLPAIFTTRSGQPKHRGFFGRLKDKAIGTKEEREALWKKKQEEDRLRLEAQRQRVQQMIMARQQLYANHPQHGYRPAIVGTPHGGGYGSYRRRPGGGMGLPLLGGLAGGLLLGEALDHGGGGFAGGVDFAGF